MDAEGKLQFRLEQVVDIEAQKEKISRQNGELIASNAFWRTSYQICTTN